MWNGLNNLNLETFRIFDEIKSHNSYWSKYTTVYFVVYILEICYLSYAFLFVPTNVGIKRLFFIFFTIEFILLLIYITLECSRVVTTNERMHRDMQQISLKFKTSLTITELLKLDQMEANGKMCQEFVSK